MQEDAERVDPHAARDADAAGTVHGSGSHDHVWNSESLAVVDDDLLLLDLGKAIGVRPALRMLFDRARLVQKPPSRCAGVRVYGERTDVDKPAEALVLETRLKKIT